MPRGFANKWSADKVDTIIVEWQRGTPVEDIAKIVESDGPSVYSLVARLRKRGLPLKTRSNSQRAKYNIEDLRTKHFT